MIIDNIYIDIVIYFFVWNSEKADDVNQATFDVQDVKSQIYSKCIIEEFNGVSINNKIIWIEFYVICKIHITYV